MLAALMLLLLPLAECAPTMHSHTPPPPCDTTTCRVSDQSLNSALFTFLCFTKEETSAMEEKDKKKQLAAAISPFLEGVREEELVAMDSQALVSLVNLVLHEGSSMAVKKTRKLHLEDLVKSVARASNLDMKPKFYKNVDSILLALLNCQSKTIAEIHELVEPMAGGDSVITIDRTGRGIFDFVNTIKTKIQGMKSTIPGLNKLPLNMQMPGADPKQALPGANDKLGMAGADKITLQTKLPGNLLGMVGQEIINPNLQLSMANLPGNLLGKAGEEKINIQTKKELLLSLEVINGLVNLMQKTNPATTAAPGTTAASTGTTAAAFATITASSKPSSQIQQVLAMIQSLTQKINKINTN